jgi:adenylosuccinate lyase
MAITSLSPLDGRYERHCKPLQSVFSEYGLIRYRIFVESRYLVHLMREKCSSFRTLTGDEITLLESLWDCSEEDAAIVKQIETRGYKDIPATNHDVKAVEYFIKIKLADTSLSDLLEMVHFALTSEDINNTSYALMIKDGFNFHVAPLLMEIYTTLYQLAQQHADTPMLARTHGQPASPTTFGKEILVFVSRLREELRLIQGTPLLAKLNGATGNFNAHAVSLPDLDWVGFSTALIDSFNSGGQPPLIDHIDGSLLSIAYNPVTTQIEPHDCFGRLFDSLKRINTILIDFSQDIWRYVSDGWIRQRVVAGEIGSSAMPHKVNPIDFENAEGNLGLANALFGYFTGKLSISRLQRDLSDSTVQRNIGVAFGHMMVAFRSLQKGLTKIEVDAARLDSVLEQTPEVLAEAYQNILRLAGVKKPYELLKEITRGKKATIDDFHQFARSLDIDEDIKKRMLQLTPSAYTGLAAEIVGNFEP